MALETHDLALALHVLDAGGTTQLALGGFEGIVVRVAVEQRYEHSGHTPALLLVLEGVGSIAVDDWRATLAGGHLVAVPAQSRLVVTADGGTALSLLLTRVAAGGPAEPPTPPAP